MKVRVSGILRYWSYVVLGTAGIRASLYGHNVAIVDGITVVGNSYLGKTYFPALLWRSCSLLISPKSYSIVPRTKVFDGLNKR